MKFLKDLKYNSIISSVLMIVLGLILTFFPGVSLNTLALIVGLVAICAGLFSIIRYFTYDLKESFYRNDFLFGIIILTIGILILFKREAFISIIPFILGVVIIFSGFSKLQDGIDAKRIGYPNHALYLTLALIDVIIGILILFDPFTFAGIMFVVIGIGLVFSGISDLYVTFYLAGRFKEFLAQKELPKESSENKEEAQDE